MVLLLLTSMFAHAQDTGISHSDLIAPPNAEGWREYINANPELAEPIPDCPSEKTRIEPQNWSDTLQLMSLPSGHFLAQIETTAYQLEQASKVDVELKSGGLVLSQCSKGISLSPAPEIEPCASQFTTNLLVTSSQLEALKKGLLQCT